MRSCSHSLLKFLCLIGALWLSLAPAVNAVAQENTQSTQTAPQQSRIASFTIGHVTQLEGQGWLLHSDETKEKLRIGLAVRQGDSIHTAHQSTATIKFNDESTITVKQSSQVNIEEYRWDEKNKSGISIIDFIKGTFRAISGLIAEAEPENYAIKTPVATIGVRGTDFGARYCESHTCVIQSGEDSLTLSQGIYIGVLDGQISITSNAHETLVDAGNAIYQKDALSPVKPVQNLPGLIFSAAELKTYSAEIKVPFYAAFLLNADGKIIRDSQGGCVRSNNYRSNHNVAECQ